MRKHHTISISGKGHSKLQTPRHTDIDVYSWDSTILAKNKYRNTKKSPVQILKNFPLSQWQ